MKKLIFISMTIITLMACSCNQEIGTDETLSVDTNSIGLKKSVTGASVKITCNGAWTADISGSWATISPTYGSGNGTISLRTTTNNTTSKRYCTISISSGTSTQKVDVVQTYY